MTVYNKLNAFLLLLLACASLHATPSTVYWTVCTTDVYPTGTGHIDDDNYFTVFNRRKHGSELPTDIGFELGLLSWDYVSVEAGLDYLGGTDDPLFFNIGAAIQENTLFCEAPSFKVGYFGAGTHAHGHPKTNYNIVDIVFGKTLPDWLTGGRLFVGGFTGSHSMGKNRHGFMVAYQKGFCPTQYCCGDKEYYKWVLAIDYASGKNVIGGGGFGIYYYFTPDISILTGPVWFNSTRLEGDWKWTVQVDISFSVFDPEIGSFSFCWCDI